MKRAVRAALTVLVTALCTAYILWQIDVGRTVDVLRQTDVVLFVLATALTVATVPGMALRWDWLLRAKGIRDRFAWLLRAYFVSYAAGQVLPTSVGGDAVRIYETVRRHPGHGGTIAGSVLLERAIGGAVTLALAAVGFALAVGRYDVGAYLWVEGVFVVLTVLAGVVLFSRTVRRPLRRFVPLFSFLRVERPVRAVYEGIHAYRANVRALVAVAGLTAVIQFLRIVSIWAGGKAVGVELGLRPYIVLGPLLFLVMLVPFTLNGLAVREAFFVSFLTQLGVGGDEAFATGFLFFVTTVAMALPGAAIVAWEGVRRGARARPA